jgi:diguanylate cyclase (GGDEF)-like protein
MRTLVVDDDPVSALVLRKTLERMGHEPVVASSGLEALERHRSDPFPVIVSEWMMPGMDGLTLCRYVRDDRSDAYTYVILLTAKTQRRDRLEALQAGIDDFLTKPLDSAELAARLNVADRIVVSDTKLRELNASLLASSKALASQAVELDRLRREAEYMATHDALTGILSRRAWFDAAAIVTPLSLAVFDIDHFKAINDRYGHPVGDRVLQEVTSRLVSAVEPFGSVGRLGGEEFGVLFEVPLPEAEAMCARAVAAVGEAPVQVNPDTGVLVTISAGLVPWLVYGRTFDDALTHTYEEADAALYQAKRTGRQRLVVQLPRAA